MEVNKMKAAKKIKKQWYVFDNGNAFLRVLKTEKNEKLLREFFKKNGKSSISEIFDFCQTNGIEHKFNICSLF